MDLHKTKYNRNELIGIMDEMEQSTKERQIRKKIPYWKAAGAILGPEFQEKWNDFVDKRTSEDAFYPGSNIDETLMVLSMLKAKMPVEDIVKVINCNESPGHLLDDISIFTGMDVTKKLEKSLNNNGNSQYEKYFK